MTNLKGVDLSTYLFDFDLTFAALLMNADGTVYHRYGGRDETSSMTFLGMPSFVRLLQQGLASHQAHRTPSSMTDSSPSMRSRGARQTSQS